MRLDARDKFPSGMEEYLAHYGWHFSKKMCDWACKNMYKVINGRKEYIAPYTKEQIETMSDNFGIPIKTSDYYDCIYVANMCKADFLGDSIPDEIHLLRYVKDVVEDPDAYKGMPFTRFYADCIGKGMPIHWEDMI